MISSRNVWTARSAVIGAVLTLVIVSALALGLAGCGRKGGLDPPPVAAAVDERGVPIQGAGAPESAPNGPPVAPVQPPPRKETWLDWLLN